MSIIEQYNSLLKQGLQLSIDHPSLMGWTRYLWGFYGFPNEKPHRGKVAPVKALLHCAAVQIQLQVTTSDMVLKPGYGTQGNIILPAPTRISQGQMADWTWPWKIKAPHLWWEALLAPWGRDCKMTSRLSPGNQCLATSYACHVARTTGSCLCVEKCVCALPVVHHKFPSYSLRGGTGCERSSK